jgi:DNA-binding beta-propeller fold protein YncE
MRPARRSTRAAVGALLAALVSLALSAPAQAIEVKNHPFQGALVSGLNPGTPPTPKLEAPCGIAVNSQGDAYVADYYHHAIGRWDHTLGGYGVLIENVATPNGPCGLAVAGNGDLYVNHWHGKVVRYAAPGFGSAATIVSGRATGIALDPGTGDLYVDEGTSVAIYEAPIAPEEAPAQRIGVDTLIDGYGVAVSAASGEVYVADATTDTVKVYDPVPLEPDSPPLRTISGAGTPQSTGPHGFVSLTDASLAIDQSNGHLFVSDNLEPGFEHPHAAVDEFDAEGLFRGALEHTVIDGSPVGIAVDESATANKGKVYVTSGNGQSNVLGGIDSSQLSSLFAYGPAGKGQTLQVTLSGAGQGAVASSPAGIACPGACKAEFNEGGLVTLSATPAPGSAFAGWSGPCSGSGSCQVTPTAATSVNAEFLPAPAALVLSSAATARAEAMPAAATPTAKKKPKRGRRRFARARTIAEPGKHRAKEKK